MHLPYPKRPPFFALRVMNAMMDTEATKSMGRDACLLVAFIATYEDRLRYTKPVQFRCSHLLQMLNFRDWRKLNNVRAEAVAAGWLNYVAPAKGFDKPGTYFVTLPDEVNGRLSAEFAGSDVDTHAYSSVDTHVDSSVDSDVDTYVDSSVYLSSPVPSTQTLTQVPNPKPKPKKTKAAKPPSFDPLSFVIPEKFDSEEMREAWQVFVAMRKSIKKPIITEQTVKRLWAKLEPCSSEVALWAIHQAIDKTWDSFFPENYGKYHSQKPASAATPTGATIAADPVSMALHQKDSLSVVIVENATRDNFDQQIKELEKLFGIGTKKTKEIVAAMVRQVFGDDIPTFKNELYMSNSAQILGYGYATKKERINALHESLNAPTPTQLTSATPEPPKERPKTQAEIELERYKAYQDAKLKNPTAFGSVTARPVALPPPPPEEPPKPKEPIPVPSEEVIEIRRQGIVRQMTGVEE